MQLLLTLAKEFSHDENTPNPNTSKDLGYFHLYVKWPNFALS